MSLLSITAELAIADEEIRVTAIRAQGSGGQNVNKVSSAVHLRFDVAASSLPGKIKQRLLASSDARMNDRGEFVIKAQRFRSREKNLADGRERLRQWILAATRETKPRRATQPTQAARERRLETKARRARLKRLRGTVE